MHICWKKKTNAPLNLGFFLIVLHNCNTGNMYQHKQAASFLTLTETDSVKGLTFLEEVHIACNQSLKLQFICLPLFNQANPT